MQMQEMRDGSFVSSPIYVGMAGPDGKPPAPCPDDTHCWMDSGVPVCNTPDGDEMTHEVCKDCHYSRVRITIVAPMPAARFEVKPGVRVQTTPKDSRGMMIDQKHLDARRAGHGVVENWVPGHGGDVWWVKHDDGQTAAYSINEMGWPKE